MTTTILAPTPDEVQDATGQCGNGLTNWFKGLVATIADDKRIVFPEGATYPIDGQNVRVVGLQDATIEFHGALFKRTKPMSKRKYRSGGPALIFRACDGLDLLWPTVAGTLPTATGYQPLYESNHGLQLAGCGDVLVEGLNVEGMWGDVIYLGQGRLNLLSPRKRSANVTVRNVYGHNIGRHGVDIAGLDDALIDLCNVTFTRRHPLHFERNSRGDGWTLVQVTEDNIFRGYMGSPSFPATFTSKAV